MDRMSGGFSDVMWRGRALAALLVVVAVAVGASGAMATSSPSLSLKAKPGVVVYKKTAKLTGALSSGKKGALIELQQRIWPFKKSFKTVAKAHTGANGAFGFTGRPSLATQYRAVAPKAHAKSATRTVYVVKALKVLRCVLTNHGHAYQGCTRHNAAPPGKYAWRITIEFVYPASVFGKEKGKPVYTYFGETKGSENTPKTLKRQMNVRQNSHGKSATVFRFVKKVTVPHGAYFLEANMCTRTTERTDGFGLPGAPGSHMCGKKTIPGNVSINKLG